MEIHAVDAATFNGADDDKLAARAVEKIEAFAELYRRHAGAIFKSARADLDQIARITKRTKSSARLPLRGSCGRLRRQMEEERIN